MQQISRLVFSTLMTLARLSHFLALPPFGFLGFMHLNKEDISLQLAAEPQQKHDELRRVDSITKRRVRAEDKQTLHLFSGTVALNNSQDRTFMPLRCSHSWCEEAPAAAAARPGRSSAARSACGLFQGGSARLSVSPLHLRSNGRKAFCHLR